MDRKSIRLCFQFVIVFLDSITALNVIYHFISQRHILLGHEKLVFREDDNDHFLGGKPGEPIILPCKVTHPNVSLSLFRQTRETTVQFQNEYFKVFRTDSTPENAFGRCQMRVKTFVLFTFKRFGIPRRRLKIRGGPSTLKKD
jgi:hypothetical protein